MIPVALYGVDAEMCERFFDDLPGLVTDAYEDRSYIESLYAVEAEQSIEHISIADQWAKRTPFAWPEDIVNEVEMVLRTTTYPDVSLLEHLMTLDGVDAQRISEWMHFSTNLFPIYSEKACQTLQRMGLDTPYRPDDIASYGLYVNRIEGLKLHAPAAGLPEIGLPRTRMLQLGLERFELTTPAFTPDWSSLLRSGASVGPPAAWSLLKLNPSQPLGFVM